MSLIVIYMTLTRLKIYKGVIVKMASFFYRKKNLKKYILTIDFISINVYFCSLIFLGKFVNINN